MHAYLIIFYRPSLAESQKIGFFSLDRATQTHDTEIIDMKQMTESVHELLEVTYYLISIHTCM